MNIKTLIIITIAALLIQACGNKENKETTEETAVAAMVAAPVVTADAPVEMNSKRANLAGYSGSSMESSSTSSSTVDIDKKKIIRDGDLSIETKDLQESKKKVDALLKQLNAYCESENMSNNNENTMFNLKIRVPSAQFEALVSGIEKGEDEIIYKNIQARDVTEEYVDVETRLASKRDFLQRYKELLAQSRTVEDILAVQENLRVLQEEIESQEGHLKYLNDQINYSTLNLTLIKQKEFVYKPEAKDKFSERIKKSLSNGWYSIVDGVLWVVSMWGWVVVVLVAWVILRKIRRRKQQQEG
jgi:hypothetical protein